MSLRAGVVVFPGSNCDRDMAVALARRRRRGGDGLAQGDRRCRAGLDLVAIPGGFSFGDYLRCGAIAARSPVMRRGRRLRRGRRPRASGSATASRC